MPITVRGNLKKLTQRAFADVAYKVMNESFSIYNEIGSLFDETVYRNALISRLADAVAEVQMDVFYQDFHKPYFMDMVVSGGGIFELKAINNLNSSHRNQLLNYLLLSEMHHGKLINFGPEEIEHEFVNTKLTRADRTNFVIDDTEWMETEFFGENEKLLVLDILRDWGTGLDISLYKEALAHFLDGQDRLLKKLHVFHNGTIVAQQLMPLCDGSTILRITSYKNMNGFFPQQLMRLMKATGLEYAQWINIARKKVTFKTLHLSVPDVSVRCSSDKNILDKNIREREIYREDFNL